MTRLLPLALILLVAGCASYATRGAGGAAPEYNDEALWDDDDGGGTGADDDDDAEPPEGPLVLDLDPEPGSSTHNYRDPITVRFDMSARGGGLTLYNAEGTIVPTTVEWSDDWDAGTLRPVVPLRPQSAYEVEIELGETQLSFEFSTSEIGLPPERPELLDGRAYQLDFSEARWGALDPLLEVMLDAQPPAAWMWQVNQIGEAGGEEARLYFDFGVAEEGMESQNTCAAAGRFGDPDTDVVRTGSYFRTAPADMTVTIGADPFDFEAAWIDGDFSPAGDSMEHVGFSGFLRMESVDAALDGDEAACDLLGSYGLACVQCPSEYGDCFFVEFDRVHGTWRAGLELDPVAVDEIEADEDCVGVAPDLGCSAAAAAWPSSPALLVLVGFALRTRRR